MKMASSPPISDQITAKFAELGLDDTLLPTRAFSVCPALITVTPPETITHLSTPTGGRSYTFSCGNAANLVNVNLPASPTL
jgi:hypothetical protein